MLLWLDQILRDHDWTRDIQIDIYIYYICMFNDVYIYIYIRCVLYNIDIFLEFPWQPGLMARGKKITSGQLVGFSLRQCDLQSSI